MKKLSFLLILLLISSCLAVLPVHGFAWLNGWDFRKRLSVSQSSDAGTNYQLNFTFHFGSGSDSGAVIYLDGHCQSNFSDLRFTEDDGTTFLDHWRKSYVEADQAEFWVEISANLTEAAAQIYVYYGNSEADSASDQATTFINVIDGVVLGLPMDEGEGDTVTDYSGNGNDGIATGTTIVDGKFTGKNARSFDGTNDYITVPDHASIDGLTAFCIFGWLKPEDDGNPAERSFSRRLQESGVPDVPWDIHIKVSQNSWRGIFNTDEGIAVPYAPATMTYNEWQFLMMEWDGSTITVYVNNVAGTPQSRGGTIYAGDTLFIGGVGAGTLKGIIDSQTITNSALTTSQKTNLYNNFGDVTLEEGSCLVRVWADPVPSVVAGAEEITVAPQGSLLASIIVGCIVLVPMFIAAVLVLRRR